MHIDDLVEFGLRCLIERLVQGSPHVGPADLAKRNGATEGQGCLDVNGATRRTQNFACPGFVRLTEMSLDSVAFRLAESKHRNHRQEGLRAARCPH